MKPAFLFTAIIIVLSVPLAYAQKAAKKPGMISYNISLTDYSFIKLVKDSSLGNAIKQKDWLKPGNKSFGLGISYWKGLTSHIDFSGTFTGTLANFPAYFVKGDSIGQANFSTQLDALLHFKLLKDKAIVNPFLTAGVGAGNFPGQFAAYAPIGTGLQFHFNDGAYLIIQAQWRMALTDGITNDYMQYSLGFAQKAKIKKAKKEVVKKEMPVKEMPVIIFDTDGDGVPDSTDNCPIEKGTVNGCPDRDNDGIADKDDKCKDVAGIAKYNGCPTPDADKDGIADEEDKCPQLAGVKENNGCPVIQEEVKAKVDMAAKNIFFAFASADILKKSFTSLDEVVAVMKDNPALQLKIEAHADNKGTFVRNMFWSEKRAKSVADYFIAKGIAAARITYKGYGDTQPIADNATEAGRAANRRVALKLGY
ncbi:OmpA family protein [Ferruginibacter sp.]|nr:OmpA family protein [Ferruginibacter sp.]